MARTGRGVAPAPRVPLRGFAKLLRNLPTYLKSKIERAFTEAEDLMDFHRRSVPQKQNRRRLSGLLAAPVLVGETSILGGSIRWDRIADPRIQFYEVQIDDVNAFPNPQTFQVLETFFGFEGTESAKFIRVRAVRYDGEIGNFSNVITIRPTFTAPKVFSHVFYQNYRPSGTELDDPELEVERRYGGEDAPKFYLLFEHQFYATRDVGGMSVFGFVSNRLKVEEDSDVAPWDRVRFRVNGITRMEEYFPLWATAYESVDTPGTNPTTGDPLSFYAKGGYTAAFGPYTAVIPASARGEGAFDPKRVLNFYARSDPGGWDWQFPKSARRPTRVDKNVEELTTLTGVDAERARGEEAAVFGLLGGAKTELLKFQDFGFAIPDNVTITGIKAAVKRRYAIVDDDDFLGFDYAKALNSQTINVMTNAKRVTIADDVVEFTGFGTVVALRGGGASVREFFEKTSNDKFGIGDTVATSGGWTISAFVRIQGPGASSTRNVVHVRDDGATTANRIQFHSLSDRLRVSMNDKDGTNITAQTAQGVFTDGVVQHLLVTWTAGFVDTFNPEIWIDGVSQNPLTVIGSSGTFDQEDTGGKLSIGNVISGGAANAHLSDVAIWNEPLPSSAIVELAKGKLDLRGTNAGYKHAQFLEHWWRFLPAKANIQDNKVQLIDKTDFIRSDLDDKAIAEPWPILGEFYIDGTGAAGEGGIPHDLPVGVGYQPYGGSSDLWSKAAFYASEVNAFYFGVAVSALNLNDPGITAGHAFIDHVKMTVFFTDTGLQDRIDVRVEAEAVNQFYIEREIFGGLFNAIEVGEDF